ncbi:hypothetical protein NE237_008099 [Protea cynaroides]|uniref:Uncharacterized protein n=1 Tax=Protea cynaroides TaxID=273540 RepID=A0A9Q0QX36_9MAGN|nr:hypothetical protein NE237_008099 [Protea cynaroides]
MTKPNPEPATIPTLNSPLRSPETFPPLPPLPSSTETNPPSLNPVVKVPWTSHFSASAIPKPEVSLKFIPPVSQGSQKIGVCSSEVVAEKIVELSNTLVGFLMGQRPSFSFDKSTLKIT